MCCRRMDNATRVAEMPCPKCEKGIHYIVRGDYELSCGACQGTGLRWPTLSRECLSETHDPCTKEVECYPVSVYEYVLTENCHGSGRVPDVTLAKALTAENCIHIAFDQIEGGWTCRMVLIAKDGDYGADVTGSGSTHEDAACAALLATLET